MNYDGIYSKLTQLLGGEELWYFSETKSNSQKRIWLTGLEGTHQTYKELSPAEKTEVNSIIQGLEIRIEKKISKDKELSRFINDLFHVPNENCIHVITSQGGKKQVVLSEWGFESIVGGGGVDALSKIRQMPRTDQTNVTVLLRYSDGELLNDSEVYFLYREVSKQVRSDESGKISLGMMKHNEVFQISDDGVLNPDILPITILPDIELYEVEIPYYSTGRITVKDQEDQLVKHV